MFKKPHKKLGTNIPGLDQIIGGGLPLSSAIALIGNAGSGKATLARHIVWNLLQKGSKILYYTVDQSADELQADMMSYNWDVSPFKENRTLRIVDVFSQSAKNIDERLRDVHLDKKMVANQSLQNKVYDIGSMYKEGVLFTTPLKDTANRIVIFDTLSPLLSTNADGVLQMIHIMKLATRLTKCIGIGVMHTGIHGHETEEKLRSLADCIIEIKQTEDRRSDFITIPKYMGEHDKGPFPLETSKKGLKVLPIVMPDLI